MKKKLSARERYRQYQQSATLKELSKPVGDDQLFDFTAPSGMPFKLRRPNVSLFVNMGTLPMAFAAKSNTETFTSLPPEKQAKLIEQSANIVRYICVSPKIVDDPKGDDEIGPDDVTLEDFNALAQWAGGGVEAERLGTFRGQR